MYFSDMYDWTVSKVLYFSIEVVSVVVGVGAVVATPYVLAAAGFTSAGNNNIFPVIFVFHNFQKLFECSLVSLVTYNLLNHRTFVIFDYYLF